VHVSLLWAATTTTTVLNVHRGAVLPVARVVVLAVPTTALLVFLYLSNRKRRRQ
jgi:hypothetical protein